MLRPKGIEKLVVSRFRGASKTTELNFDPTKFFVLLFGENGTGKSTIIDAVDFVCNRCGGSIMERSSTKEKDHLPTIGSRDKDIRVELSSGGKTWKGMLSGTKISITPQEGIPSATILRRSKILTLIEATPAERFKELKRFIDVDLVQKSEDGLNAAIKTAGNAVQERVRTLDAALQNLENAFKADHAPDEDGLTPEEWGRKRSETDLSKVTVALSKIKTVLDIYAAALLLEETKNTAQTDLDNKRAKLGEFKQKLEGGQIDTRTGVLLVDLLAKVGDYLDQDQQPENCPVCLAPIVPKDLKIAIQSRLEQMSDLRQLAEELAKAQNNVDAAVKYTYTNYMNLINKVVALVGAIDNLEANHKGLLEWDRSNFSALLAWPGELTRLVIEQTANFLALMPPFHQELTKRSEDLQKVRDQLNLIKQAYNSAQTAKRDAEHEKKVQGILNKMFSMIRKQRIKFTQRFLDDVADDCDRLYKAIHQNESLGGVRFVLDQEKKASLNQFGRFEGHPEIVPQAYFSDSHLDTLGFCFFLAVTRKSTGGNTIVVLDDVFTTVDLPHIKRILTVLLEESKSYKQLIFATHQRRWLDLFQTNQAPINDVCLIQLRPWSMPTGIGGDQVAPYVTQLADVLNKTPLNRREIGALSGFLIECTVGEMTKHLGCAVIRNPSDRYTGANLLDGMKKKAKGVKIHRPTKPVSLGGSAVMQDAATLEDLVTELRTLLPDGRNTVGDHFNWDSADIPDQTVIDFGKKTLSLVTLLTCEKCGCMATRNKNNHLECSCGDLQIERGA